MRLYPPRHREASFRDRVPDLPAVIHIQKAIDTNVQFIENIFANDMWASLSSEETAEAPRKKTIQRSSQQEIRHHPAPTARGNQAWNKSPNIQRNQKKINSTTRSEQSKLSAASMPSAQYDSGKEDGERSTASTQGTTVTFDQTLQAKLNAIETASKAKLSKLESTSKTSIENSKS